MIDSHLLKDMMLFVRVVELNSFTAAAAQIGVTKSMASKHISRLEKTLGAQLLQRSTRKLSLTEAGQVLFDRCQRIYTEVEEARDAILHSYDAPRGTLKINSPASFGHLHLAPAISEFISLYPEIKVEMLLGHHYDDIIENGLDLAIRIGEQADSMLIARRLSLRPMRVCASPTYLKKHGIPKRPDDLNNHQCLRYINSPTGHEWHFQGPYGLERIEANGVLCSNSSQALEQAAVSDLGIAMLPGYMMTQDIKSGRLISLLQEYCPPNIPIYAVFPKNRYLAPKVRVFVNFLVERFQYENYWSKLQETKELEDVIA